jgi:hypothetical protein
MVSRSSVFRMSASALESGARSGPDLGLGPENSLRGPIGRARALIDTGVSRRLESNRPRFPSLWCRVRVGTPRSADPAQPRCHSTGVVSELAVGQAGERRSGRVAAATHPSHALAAGRHRDARTSALGSGVAATNPCAPALLRVGEATPCASCSGRDVAPATPRHPTTTVRRSGAAPRRRWRPTQIAASPAKRARGWRPTRRLLLVLSGRLVDVGEDDRVQA